MKGGILYDPHAAGFRAVVHTWDNVRCEGKPQEWLSEQLFATEAEAMTHYRTTIQPALKEMMKKTAEKSTGGTLIHRELEGPAEGLGTVSS